MPTKRTRRPRGRNGTVTMDTLEFEQLLQLAAGWLPSKSYERERRYTKWVTWQDFISTWLAIRDEYMQHEQWGIQPVFAEQIYKTFGTSGPPADFGYDEIRAAFAAAEDRAAAELLADVDVG